MTAMKSIVAAVLGGIGLTVLNGIVAAVFPLPAMPTAPHILWWALASNILIAGAFVPAIARSTWSNASTAVAVWAVLFGVNGFNSLIEAVVFNILGNRTTAYVLFAMSVLVTALFAPALTVLSRKLVPPAKTRRQPALPRGLPVRILACSALYVITYFVAGMLIYPYIQSFYSQRPLPSPLPLIALQFCVRGPIFTGSILLFAWMIAASRWTTPLACGAMLAVVAGVAPLLVPNPFFPDAIRYAHMIEVTSSNFVFGALAAMIVTTGAGPAVRVEPSQIAIS